MFLREAKVSDEDVLWKELLVFFMNTKDSSGYLEFRRGISPFKFDPAMAGDYLDCFRSDALKSMVMDELEFLYETMGDEAGERLKLMGFISSPAFTQTTMKTKTGTSPIWNVDSMKIGTADWIARVQDC